MSYQRTNPKGITLIEILISIACFGLIITAVLNLMYISTRSLSIAEERLAADYLVEEGFAIVRSLRDTNLIKYGKSLENVKNCWDVSPDEDTGSCSKKFNGDYYSKKENNNFWMLKKGPSSCNLENKENKTEILQNGCNQYLLELPEDSGLPKFYRKISIKPQTASLVVTSTVFWQSPSGLRKQSLTKVISIYQ